MDANVVAKPPGDREEVIKALERSFLWNGENAYFMYNDSGSIGELWSPPIFRTKPTGCSASSRIFSAWDGAAVMRSWTRSCWPERSG